MALADLMTLSQSRKKIGISEERIAAIKPVARQYLAYWREYPDMFVDFLQTGRDGQIPENGLRFYFYQRVFLRAAMRYKYVYMTFPRAYSKSFLSVLVLMCRCVLYPRCKLFVTSGGKEQAAGIIKEKVNEICTLVPAFENELDLRPGKTRQSIVYLYLKMVHILIILRLGKPAVVSVVMVDSLKSALVLMELFYQKLLFLP